MNEVHLLRNWCKLAYFIIFELILTKINAVICDKFLKLNEVENYFEYYQFIPLTVNKL